MYFKKDSWLVKAVYEPSSQKNEYFVSKFDKMTD